MKKSYRPKYHASITAGWSNDPNGFIYANGKIHMFFQHYPHEPQWGTMHWGHVVSSDFIRWEDMPVAIAPDMDYEVICGCCSGSNIMKDGKMYLMYTAAQPQLQRQCLAVSDDLVHFEKSSLNPILTADMLHEEVSELDFRDPKLFRKDGFYYMIAGVRILSKENRAQRESYPSRNIEASSKPRDLRSPSALDVSASDPENDGIGNMILARSRDLEAWEYVGKLLYPEDGFEEEYFELNGVYECPDYFILGGREVLLSSPQNLPEISGMYQNIHSSLYMLGRLDFNTGRYHVSHISELDRGFDFYAAQTLEMPDGRRIMTAWKEMWDRNYPTQREGWAGTYILPRELEVRDGKLFQSPVREIEKYRKNRVFVKRLETDRNIRQAEGISGECMELSVTIKPEKAEKAGIRLFRGKRRKTLLYYDRKRKCLVFDRGKSGIRLTGREENANERICPLSGKEEMHLRIFLDVSSVEVFINDGEYVMTGNVYPGEEDTGVDFFSEGGKALFEDIEKYDIIV